MTRSSSGIFGTILVVFGLLFLLKSLGILDTTWFTDNLWSIGFILVGIWLVMKRSKRPYTGQEGHAVESARPQPFAFNDPKDRLDISEVFRSARRDVTSKNFAGGRCSVVFGSLRLDVTQAELNSGEQTLRLHCLFGKMSVKLPKDFEYSIKAGLVASGMSVKGERLGGLLQNIAVRSGGLSIAEKRLAVVASCTFGEIEII